MFRGDGEQVLKGQGGLGDLVQKRFNILGEFELHRVAEGESAFP